MRRLYLLRHSKSSWDDPAVDDFDRPLNDRGRKAAKAMAKYLAGAKIRPALVLCSAARRTRETLALLESKLRGVPVAVEDALYEAGRGDLIHRLRALDDHLGSVMLIGHNPGIGRLAETLSAGHGERKALDRLAAKFPTGALAVLETGIGHWAELDDGTCRLTEFIRPKDLDQESG